LLASLSDRHANQLFQESFHQLAHLPVSYANRAKRAAISTHVDGMAMLLHLHQPTQAVEHLYRTRHSGLRVPISKCSALFLGDATPYGPEHLLGLLGAELLKEQGYMVAQR
jgi:hypothetical protein